jgi:peptidoglycan/xylan/chitin deacetylase (PgdA/CDA1 family)
MTMRGLGWFRHAVRRLTGFFERRVIILVYHRITELHSDPWSLAVTMGHFAEHLEVLRRHVHPIRLRQLANALRHDDLPRRSAVVTFDDGYADNLHHGKPLLERYDIPATVFVTTGSLGTTQEFWWDELDRLFLQPGSLPRELCVTVKERTYSSDLGEVASYSEDTARRHSSWKAWEAAPSPRHAVYQSLCKQLRTLPTDERRQVLERLLAWAGLEPEGRPTHRTLTPDEVLTLERGDLVEIGAHTVTHPALAVLPAASQRQEIEQSKTYLEKLLGRLVTSFAYPFGGRHDYTADTVGAVRAAGFASACSTCGGVVGPSTDLYQLPRIYVHDCDGEQFANLLSRWLLP